MGLAFYYSPMSTAAVTDCVLEELAVPCERVRVDLEKGDTRKPGYLRLNPNGKVPMLVHDGISIWESAAITLYLGEIFGVSQGLYPAPGAERGAAMKWIVWANATLAEAAGRVQRNTTELRAVEQHTAEAAAGARSDLHRCLRILDGALEGQSYLLSGYSVADTHVSVFVDWLRHMEIDLAPYTNVHAWHRKCSARPAYARSMART